MKLAVFNPVMGQMDLEESLKYLSALGVEAMEMGVGGYPGKNQLDPKVYLDKPEAIVKLKALFQKYNMEIAALSCHGNPISPDKQLADSSHNDFIDACRLAKQLDVKTVITFSGCPGGSEIDKMPNWVTCSWPEEYQKVLDYQWNEVLVPYWKNMLSLLDECDVNVAFEMHPGFCVYNPATMLKLRKLVGSERLGVNFDPSHLFWQQIDPLAAIKELKDCMYHFHAKDTYLDQQNIKINGVLDTGSYGNLLERSWYFKTVGYGHDQILWKQMINRLKEVGYNGVISIEHEDTVMSTNEGLEKAIMFLGDILIREQASEAWWY
ncbi:MAG: sugar phosphate isomerase/epimerase family protein [Erysipelotrichaceae bacterium]